MFDAIGYQGNANHNHTEVPRHTHQGGENLKIGETGTLIHR